VVEDCFGEVGEGQGGGEGGGALMLDESAAILGVNLPGMTRVDLAPELRARCPDCRILLFSGRPETLHIVAAAERSGDRFEAVAKPVHPALLLEWLNSGKICDGTARP
jgi:DNA-binding response OmpR family regulator